MYRTRVERPACHTVHMSRCVGHTRRLILPANLADAYAGLVSHLLRQPAHVQDAADRTLALSVERGYPYLRALARQGMAAGDELGQRLHHSQLAAMLAEACPLVGHFVEALEVAEEAIASFAVYHDLLCDLEPDPATDQIRCVACRTIPWSSDQRRDPTGRQCNQTDNAGRLGGLAAAPDER